MPGVGQLLGVLEAGDFPEDAFGAVRTRPRASSGGRRVVGAAQQFGAHELIEVAVEHALGVAGWNARGGGP